jgi:hypothetical protein
MLGFGTVSSLASVHRDGLSRLHVVELEESLLLTPLRTKLEEKGHIKLILILILPRILISCQVVAYFDQVEFPF